MSLWGNKDSKSANGTIAIASNGTVTGTSTLFTSQAKVGDYIRVAGEDYVIKSIASNTSAVVTAGVRGATLSAVSPAAAYTLSETYVLNKGKIVFKHIGPMNADIVEKILQLKKLGFK